MTNRGFGVLLVLMGVGCAAKPSIEKNRASVREPDGRYSFYAGKGIGDILARGEAVRDDHPTPFMRLRVPSTMMELAAAKASAVKTVSFEVPDPSIEATIHWFAPVSNNGEPVKTAAMTNSVFHPGDPWLTGYAQVATDATGVTMGFFSVTRWNRKTVVDALGNARTMYAEEVHSTGLMADDEELPALKYEGDPTNWAAIPDGWK